GKIGRIEIESATTSNKTYGKLFLPSSLGRVETCILAAAVESVDRVGPFDTNLKVEKIEDTRSEKRKKVVNRAKELLKTLINTEMPDSKELSELVEVDVKASTISTYGPENLPAGPDIESNDDIILVEGRADVINLLKNDITNCIAIGGATGSIPKTIIDISKSKDTTLFVDGDRGGDMIIRGIISVCDVDFIAKAPSGKEVEELTRKDIIKALRARIPIDQFLSREGSSHSNNGSNAGASSSPSSNNVSSSNNSGNRPFRQESKQERYAAQSSQNMQREQHIYNQNGPREQRVQDTAVLSPTAISRKLYVPSGGNASANEEQHAKEQEMQRPVQQAAQQPSQDLGIKHISGEGEEEQKALDSIPSMDAENVQQQKYIDALDELHNTLRGRLYDGDGNLIEEIPIRELIQAIQDSANARIIVFDGIITQRLLELSSKKGIKAIYGIRAGQITRQLNGMVLYAKEQGGL
ncbi:MAG: DNA primase DnaG, partial [Candidatus Micrarchaeaceae archaeon]